MTVAAGATDAGGHAHHQTVRRFERRTVRTMVLDTGVRIPGNDVGRRQRGRAVESRCGYGYRQAVESVPRAQQVYAFDDDLLATRRFDLARRDRVGYRMVPTRLDFVERRSHAHAIYPAVARECADHHRKLILAPAAIDDMGKQKRLALVFFDAADELPAHQRV